MHRQYFWMVACLLVLASCASTSPESRRESVDDLTLKNGWKKQILASEYFGLASYVPTAQTSSIRSGDTLTVFIEGDGFAFRGRRPSEDPTPLNPVALKVAFRQGELFPTQLVAYLARPCQYVIGHDARNCDEKFWATHRFSSEVITATNNAISQLKDRSRASTLVLVGYSGGGAVAALVAAKRNDVKRLVTIAGTLDHPTWTSLHKVSPMTGSLNASNYWKELQSIPQVHFVGGKDKIMPVTIAEAYRAKFSNRSNSQIHVIDEFDHVCCWAEQWQTLQSKAF